MHSRHNDRHVPGDSRLNPMYICIDTKPILVSILVNKDMIPVYTVSYLEFVLASIDDDSSNLLVHEDQDATEEGWNDSSKVRPPWIYKERDEPAPVRTSWLESIKL